MWHQKPPLGVPLDWSNPLNDGLMMHLAMNEGHGDKVQDLSMNGNHGTLNGFAFPPTVASGWNPGQTGIGLKFDGVDDYVATDCSSSSSVPKYTFSAWVNPDSYSSYRTIFCLSNAATMLIKDGDLRVVDGGITNYLLPIITPVKNWVCFVYTYDGSEQRLYENGNLMGAPVVAPSDLTPFTWMSLNRPNMVRMFVGAIDQPRIQNRAWSAKEVMDYAINPWQVYLDEDD